MLKRPESREDKMDRIIRGLNPKSGLDFFAALKQLWKWLKQNHDQNLKNS